MPQKALERISLADFLKLNPIRQRAYLERLIREELLSPDDYALMQDFVRRSRSTALTRAVEKRLREQAPTTAGVPAAPEPTAAAEPKPSILDIWVRGAADYLTASTGQQFTVGSLEAIAIAQEAMARSENPNAIISPITAAFIAKLAPTPEQVAQVTARAQAAQGGAAAPELTEAQRAAERKALGIEEEEAGAAAPVDVFALAFTQQLRQAAPSLSEEEIVFAFQHQAELKRLAALRVALVPDDQAEATLNAVLGEFFGGITHYMSRLMPGRIVPALTASIFPGLPQPTADALNKLVQQQVEALSERELSSTIRPFDLPPITVSILSALRNQPDLLRQAVVTSASSFATGDADARLLSRLGDIEAELGRPQGTFLASALSQRDGQRQPLQAALGMAQEAQATSVDVFREQGSVLPTGTPTPGRPLGERFTPENVEAGLGRFITEQPSLLTTTAQFAAPLRGTREDLLNRERIRLIGLVQRMPEVLDEMRRRFGVEFNVSDLLERQVQQNVDVEEALQRNFGQPPGALIGQAGTAPTLALEQPWETQGGPIPPGPVARSPEQVLADLIAAARAGVPLTSGRPLSPAELTRQTEINEERALREQQQGSLDLAQKEAEQLAKKPKERVTLPRVRFQP